MFQFFNYKVAIVFHLKIVRPMMHLTSILLVFNFLLIGTAKKYFVKTREHVDKKEPKNMIEEAQNDYQQRNTQGKDWTNLCKGNYRSVAYTIHITFHLFGLLLDLLTITRMPCS